MVRVALNQVRLPTEWQRNAGAVTHDGHLLLVLVAHGPQFHLVVVPPDGVLRRPVEVRDHKPHP
eukprot:6898407-Lingulodinium_polyedra.AAC.1